ncbi:MAG: hypothetical protein DSY37_03060 [Hyperthermus sp.]|nr:MAG: hypothetical protein DSY37_03060 [Hyperthermus sp.]
MDKVVSGREGGGEGAGKAALREARLIGLSIPRLSLLAPSLAASLPTLMPGLLLSFNPGLGGSVFYLFIILYFVLLPVIVAGLYSFYRIVSSMVGRCGVSGESVSIVPFVMGVLPLGFLIPQYYVLGFLSRCGGGRPRPSLFLFDLMVNFLTFGALIVFYGVLLERVVRVLAREVEEQG